MQDRFQTQLMQHPLMIAGMLFAAATGAMGFASLAPDTYEVPAAPAVREDVGPELAQLRADMVQLERSLARAPAAPSPDNAAVRKDVALLRERLGSIEARQRAIERVIIASPAKSLELPMMRKDIADLRASREREATYFSQSIDRIYDFNKWFLGGIVISLMLMALDRFFGGRGRLG
ncbi:hypothetical protein [Sphingomonas sp. SRS2]|uniref:hypothetical protein n=1 Tax=Sphingomonas sp. SRS2 TaxID=133190 RepID=UPI000AB3E650|nr:hypothetical protein [Sphingomonas sp. SRS2]